LNQFDVEDDLSNCEKKFREFQSKEIKAEIIKISYIFNDFNLVSNT